MPSTNKTPLGLNQWLGTDKPDLADFNTDNSIMDSVMSGKAATAHQHSASDITNLSSATVKTATDNLLPGNIKAGENVTVSVSGKDVTINSTGGGGGGGIEEAPIDGKQYARQNADWSEVAEPGSTLVVIDNLNSTDKENPLSANMGGVLDGKIKDVRNSNFIGNGAGANTIGDGNVAFGKNALFNNSHGYNNTAIGCEALSRNFSGYNNTAIGYEALSQNYVGTGVPGNTNTAIGSGALAQNITGSWNTAIGSRALAQNTTAGWNTAIGNEALYANTTGALNTAIGYGALYANTTGSVNIAIGRGALAQNTTAKGNVAIGNEALYANTTGESNTAIGGGANVSGGNLYNSTAIGSSAICSNSNQITLGNPYITQLRCQVQTISSLSDKRIKEDIQPADTSLCLESVKSLPVSRYKFKDFTGTHLDQHVTGWMADDVEKVFPKAVQKTDEWYPELDENGEKIYEDVTNTRKEYDADGNEIEVEYTEQQEKKFVLEDVKSITMTEALPTLWGAVQALSKQVEELQAELLLMKSR